MTDLTKQFLAVATGFLLAYPAHASEGEPTDQPRVVSYGRFEGGAFAFCTGPECAQALASLEDKRAPYELELTLDAENGIDHGEFCQLMKDQQPENCDASDPPSTPGTDPGWEPNACGTSGFSNLLLDSGIGSFYSESYSGNFNAPFPGVSFRGACNDHDACWGVAGSRATCDNNFHESMRSACGSVAQASSRTVCDGFAAAYFSAVSATNIGNNNYQQSVESRKCALWAYDMKINGCD